MPRLEIASTTRRVLREPREVCFALADLRTEGLDHLIEIAAEYHLCPRYLAGRFTRTAS